MMQQSVSHGRLLVGASSTSFSSHSGTQTAVAISIVVAGA